MELSDGMALFTVNTTAPDDPPPGLKTVICFCPAVERSADVGVNRSTVELTKVVARLLPFQRAVDVAMKFEPCNVTCVGELPARAEFGETEVRTGGVPSTVKFTRFEKPPPGGPLKTFTP